MRAEKTQIVQEIQGLITGKQIILISYKGLTAADLTAFRNTLAGFGAVCHVVPNTLLSVAAKAAGINCLDGVTLSGDTAMISGDDAVALAKAARDLAKAKKDIVTIKLGVVENQLLNAADVEQLADLPPKEVLQAQLLGLLNAPAGQLVRVLNAKVSTIVYVLNAFLGKKEQAA